MKHRRVPRRYVSHAKRDANHSEVVAAFVQMGSPPIDASTIGGGFPDLIVPICGVTLLVEVKAEEGRLEASQTRFAAEWRGGPIRIARSRDDAIRIVTEFRDLCARRYR